MDGERRKKTEEEQKSVLTMASYVLHTPLRLAHASHQGLKSVKTMARFVSTEDDWTNSTGNMKKQCEMTELSDTVKIVKITQNSP